MLLYTNHWANEAVVKCKEMLPLFLSAFVGGEWK